MRDGRVPRVGVSSGRGGSGQSWPSGPCSIRLPLPEFSGREHTRTRLKVYVETMMATDISLGLWADLRLTFAFGTGTL